MSKLIIQEIDAYEKYSNPTYTSNRITGIIKVTHGKTTVYFMPYGSDYECEGGHFIDQLSEIKFNKLFSLTKGK